MCIGAVTAFSVRYVFQGFFFIIPHCVTLIYG